MRLEEKLKGLDTYPFHMPGHKRNKKFGITGSEIDITEIDGFDNLHCPRGVIADIENDLKKIYRSKKSLILMRRSSIFFPDIPSPSFSISMNQNRGSSSQKAQM